jgi:hypothetical protein
MLLVELKSDVGRLTAPQRYVHACLRAAGLSVHTWRPRDWETVVAALNHAAAVDSRSIETRGTHMTPNHPERLELSQ